MIAVSEIKSAFGVLQKAISAVLLLNFSIAACQKSAKGGQSAEDEIPAAERPISVTKGGAASEGGFGGAGGVFVPKPAVPKGDPPNSYPSGGTDSFPPVKKPHFAIHAGYSFNCVTTDKGALECWGTNLAGQLGFGGGRIGTTYAVPEAPYGITSGVVDVAGGGDHTCALTVDGGLKCWGSNSSGQLWDPPSQYWPLPATVEGIRDVYSVAAGVFHTCAAYGAGGVKCWGLNHRGQTGQGHFNETAPPGDVVGLVGRTIAVAAGRAHNCSLDEAGEVRCWGSNEYGELGDGTYSHRSAPSTPVPLGEAAKGIFLGGNHSCAILVGGGVKCWGRNEHGQLGDGGSVNRAVPAPVSGLTVGVSHLALGSSHTCALDERGDDVLCWGKGDLGQLGYGGTSGSTSPVRVTGLRGRVGTIASGAAHVCAMLADTGAVQCWGGNGLKQLGGGTAANQSAVPVVVTGGSLPPLGAEASVTLTDNGPAGLANAASYVIQGTCSEPGRPVEISGAVTATASCQPDETFTHVADLSGLPDGTFTVTANFINGSGEPATPVTITLLKDTVRPTVLITSSGYVNASNAASYSVRGTCSENAGIVTIAGSVVGSATCVSGMFSAALDYSSQADGPVPVTASMSDAAGNVSMMVSATLVLDRVPPTVTINNSPAVDSSNAGAYQITGTCSEINRIVTIGGGAGANTLNGMTACSAAGTFSLTRDLSAFGSGPITVTAVQTDAAGNVSTTATINLTKI